MEKLTIARYKDGYIDIEQYNRSIHKNGYIFCPFCDPKLEVTGVRSDFFRAMPGRGGHNCDKKSVEYFNPDWEGRQLIEKLNTGDGMIQVTIDINKLYRMGTELSTGVETPPPTHVSSASETDTYNRYKAYRKIVRDIIRTVKQMKNFIEKNSIDDLKKIRFQYKMGTETLDINEVIKLIDELTPTLHQKERFILFKVENVKPYDGKIYFNSYQTEGIRLTATFQYPANDNRTGIKKNDYVIAFGKISYSNKQDKYYLNIKSDLNIVKIKNAELTDLFSQKEMTRSIIYKPKNDLQTPLAFHSVNASEEQKMIDGLQADKPNIMTERPTTKAKQPVHNAAPRSEYRETTIPQINTIGSSRICESAPKQENILKKTFKAVTRLFNRLFFKLKILII